MNLKNLTVDLTLDGFRILDPQDEIDRGTLLQIQYECGEGWVTRELEFERERPTFWHPFRKSMFVYTGTPPTRVLIQGFVTGQSPFSSPRRQRDGFDFDDFYQQRNFFAFPRYEDAAWATDELPAFLGIEFEAAAASQTPPSQDAPPQDAQPCADTPEDLWCPGDAPAQSEDPDCAALDAATPTDCAEPAAY